MLKSTCVFPVLLSTSLLAHPNALAASVPTTPETCPKGYTESSVETPVFANETRFSGSGKISTDRNCIFFREGKNDLEQAYFNVDFGKVKNALHYSLVLVFFAEDSPVAQTILGESSPNSKFDFSFIFTGSMIDGFFATGAFDRAERVELRLYIFDLPESQLEHDQVPLRRAKDSLAIPVVVERR